MLKKYVGDPRKTRSSHNLYDDFDEDYCIQFKDLRRVSSLGNVSGATKQIKSILKRRRARKKFSMAERLDKAAPYNIFFNCLIEVPETYDQTNSIMFSGG